MTDTGQPMLSGVRVIEQGAFITGPYASMLLADLGADVVKVERPDGGDPFRHYAGESYSPQFQAYNRNKRSMTIDINKAKDLEALDALVAKSDVFIQNFRPGVAKKLRVDYERLAGINPRLIYCSISGFGASGPYVDRPSYDTVAQALSGYLNMLIDPDNPRIMGPAIADSVTGLYAAQGIIAAIYNRERTGRGRLVEVSMLEAMTHFAVEPFSTYFQLGETPGAFGRAAVSQSYVASCADGKMLAIHLSSPPKFWAGLLTAIERPDLADDPRFATRDARVANHDALRVELQGVFSSRERKEWLKRLIAEDVPSAPVNDLPDVLIDPQTHHLKLVTEAEHPQQGKVRLIRPPIRFDGEVSLDIAPPPLLGEHDAELKGM